MHNAAANMDIEQVKSKIAQMRRDIAKKQHRLRKWEKAALLMKNPSAEDPASKSFSSDVTEDAVEKACPVQSSSSTKPSTVRNSAEKSSTSGTARKPSETKVSTDICASPGALKPSKTNEAQSPRTPTSRTRKQAIAESPENPREFAKSPRSHASANICTSPRTMATRSSKIEAESAKPSDSSSKSPGKTRHLALESKNITGSHACSINIAESGDGKMLRRSARKSQSSYILKSDEFVTSDSRLTKETKLEAESETQDSEGDDSSSEEASSDTQIDARTDTDTSEILGTAETHHVENVESNSGDLQITESGSGSTLRRSARKPQSSYILKSQEFVVLDSRLAKRTDSDPKIVENDSSSSESLEMFPASIADKSVVKMEAESHSEIGRDSTLRRSARRSCSSYVLNNDEFIVDSRLCNRTKSEAESDTSNAESDSSSSENLEILPDEVVTKSKAKSHPADEQIAASSGLRRSVRQPRSSCIMSSGEFVLSDSRLAKNVKSEAESHTKNAESKCAGPDLRDAESDNDSPEKSGTAKNRSVSPACESVTNQSEESHSNSVQEAEIDRGSALRRSARQSRTSYILNSGEFIMLDSRLCKRNKSEAESDTQDTESNSSSAECLGKEGTGCESVPKSEAESFSVAESDGSLRLRRSVRQSRSSYVLSSDEFVMADSRLVKGKKKWCHALRESSPEPGPNPCFLFPKLPPTATAGPIVEFQLPEDEFEAWKRRFRRRDQDSEGDSLNEREPLRRSESWTVLGQTSVDAEAGTEEEAPNAEFQQTTLSEFQASVELKSSTSEPIELLHCGQVHVAADNRRRAVAACQKCKISVWTEFDGRWLLLVEIPLTLANANFYTFSGFSTENGMGVALVKATGHEKMVLSYDFSPDVKSHCLESVALKKPVQKICAILSCIVGETLVCATIHPKVTYLRTYDLKSREKRPPSDMEKVEDVLNSLLPVADLDHAVIGFSSTFLYVWNHHTGDLVTRIHAPDRATFLKCAFAQEESGLLILGVIMGEENHQHNLMAVNPTSEKWRILHPYQEVVEIPNQNLTGAFQVESYLMAGGGETGRVAIWNIFSGHLVAFLNDTSITAFGTFPTESSSDFLVATGSQNGNVTMYKLPLLQL